MKRMSKNNLNLIWKQNKNASKKARMRFNARKKILNNVNRFNELELVPITYAIRNQDLSHIKKLIKNGARLDIGSELPLYTAVLTGNKSIVNLLLKNNANPNQYISSQSDYDMVFHPPIVAAIADFESSIKEQQNSLSIILSLLNHGANINLSKFNRGHTALYSACDNGHPNIVMFLLNKGANPNIQIISGYDDDGFTPLHIAIKNGYTDVINVLLKSGLLSVETIDSAKEYLTNQIDEVYAGQRLNNSGLMPQQIKRNNIKSFF